MTMATKRWAVLSAAVAGVSLTLPAATQAAVFTWDGGGGDNNWGTANNWALNVAPTNSDQTDLEFGTVALVSPFRTTANNTVSDFNLNSITFGSTANASFSLTGSQFDFKKDGVVQPSIVQNSNLAHSIANGLKISGDNFTLGGNGTGLITITGQISGGKPLIKTGTSTYLLSGNNNNLDASTTINGGTIIVGHANALDNNTGTITVNNTGTLAVNTGITFTRPVTFNSGSTLAGKGTYSPAAAFTVGNNVTVAPGIGDIGTLAIANATTFGAGGRFSVDVSGANADRLNVTGNLTLNATSVAQFNVGAAPTLGRYRILDYTGTLTGTFGSSTGVPSNYKIDYNNTDTAVDLRRRSTIGAIVATPVDATIITGGSTGVSFTVQNTAPTDSFDLAFTGTAGTNMTGAAGGTVAANSTGGPSSNTLAFNGTTVGNGQLGSFSVSDAEATNSPQAGGVSVNVLAHSNASFSGGSDDNTLLLDFGTVNQNAGGGTISQGFGLHNLLSNLGVTAGLDLDSFLESGDTFNKFSSSDLATFLNLAAGSSDGSTIDFDTTTLGVFSATYTLSLSDEDLPGATGGQSLILNLTGEVIAVPEPTSLGLLGVAAMGLLARRRRRVG